MHPTDPNNAALTHNVCPLPAYPATEVRDPTGAGDSFAGGFMGALAALGQLGHPDLRMAMIVGSTIASFAVEDFSLDRFRRLTVEEIRERYAAFRELTEFPDLPGFLPVGDR